MSASLGISFKILQNCGKRLVQHRNLLPCISTVNSTYFSVHKPLLSSENISNVIICNRTLTTLPLQNNNYGILRKVLQMQTPQLTTIRTKVRYSMQKGKPKTVKAVIRRFYRLDWGAWIRTRAGRRKKLWKKTNSRKYRLRQHVICTKTQSSLLDHMVTDYWKKPRHYVDDPYAPYHKRTNFKYSYERPPFLP